MQTVKTPTYEIDPKHRIKNFDAVDLGYNIDEAVREAERCYGCANPKCSSACPVGIDIPKFIAQIKERDIDGALDTILEKNLFPSICGRVCPQESQCEGACIAGIKGEPVAIGRLERFVGDQGNASPDAKKRGAFTGKQVAIIGSGPAGLACAGELAKFGHKVTIFEALHKTGGVLIYGIPEFRLPKAIVDREVQALCDMGVDIEINSVAGKVITVDDLFNKMGYDAIFVALGAGLPQFMHVKGEQCNGVFSANEFLTRVNLMHANESDYDTPIHGGDQVVVVGGGNVAMDAARTALRLGCRNVTILYRRTKAEMPARAEEIRHATEEGIVFKTLSSPIEFRPGDDGYVRYVICQEMELGEPDASGRRRPIPIEGETTTIVCDTAIVAVGTQANATLMDFLPDAKRSSRGYLECDENGATSVKGVWAGGDIATGSATVILAMGAGKKAAASIDEYLNTL